MLKLTEKQKNKHIVFDSTKLKLRQKLFCQSGIFLTLKEKSMKLNLTALAFFLTLFSFAQNIHYKVRMEKPQSHYFQVSMEITNNKSKSLTVKMPVWAPGSYLVREFAKNVNQVRAVDEHNKALKVVKSTKNAWVIAANKAKSITVSYEVYAFELSVRTSFLDLTHGFISSSGIFMFLDGSQKMGGLVTVFPHQSFKTITTPLEFASEQLVADGSKTFQFPNYDVLADSPIEVGNQKVFEFTVGETKHTVAMYGDGSYDIESLKSGMARVVKACNSVFNNVNPNKNYTFIVHNVLDGQGGLEHANSCVLSVNRWVYGGDINDFYNLVAHEYFHLWNVKRIRPIELGPFNYDAENYTSMLWFSEGFTSYYADLLLARAGFTSKDEFIKSLQGKINYVEGSLGARVQSVAASSFDAWIKAYRPNENSANTTVSYYSKGTIIGAYLDALIIDKSNKTKCLDHFMQYLYNEYAIKRNRGFTVAEFKWALEQFIGMDMTEFFEKYIDGVEVINYEQVLPKAGVEVVKYNTTSLSLGANLSQEGGRCIVKSVRSGSPAETAGLSVGDELISIDNSRADKAGVESYVNSMQDGDVFGLIVSRDEELTILKVEMKAYKSISFSLSQAKSNADKLDYWLRKLE